MSNHSLLADIEAFCAEHGLSEAKFGVLALKDWKLVRDLRGIDRPRPRRLWPETEETIRNFMRDYQPEAERVAA